MPDVSSIAAHCKAQYALVKGSRHVLFDYCRNVYPKDLLNENSSFGRGGSMRNLLVHIANVYESWIGQQALKKEMAFTTYESRETIHDICALFDTIDALMDEFLLNMDSPEMQEISYVFNNETHQTSAFQIFTHVITHEFHHKGQILSLSRHLGYTPVDTDIIR